MIKIQYQPIIEPSKRSVKTVVCLQLLDMFCMLVCDASHKRWTFFPFLIWILIWSLYQCREDQGWGNIDLKTELFNIWIYVCKHREKLFGFSVSKCNALYVDLIENDCYCMMKSTHRTVFNSIKKLSVYCRNRFRICFIRRLIKWQKCYKNYISVINYIGFKLLSLIIFW